jgi:hypothetical protein
MVVDSMWSTILPTSKVTMNMRSCAAYVPVQNTTLYKRIRRQIIVVCVEDAEVGDVVEVPGAEGVDPPAKRARYR